MKNKSQKSQQNLELEELKRQAEFASKEEHTIGSRIRRLLRIPIRRFYQYPARNIEISKHYHKLFSLKKIPSISVVTPSLNQGYFIEQTIKSVLEQDYSALEYIVQDGKSKDNTVDILKKYQNQLTHWESVQDSGQSQAINLGFQHAHGEIMAYLNSDDILLPGALNYVAHYFETHPEIDVIYSHRIIIDEKGSEVGRWVLPAHDNKVIEWIDYIPQETLFWRRRIWDKIGGKIDESFQFAMDWDLILRFKEAGARFARVPRFLGAFRVHPNQKTSAWISEKGFKEIDQLRYRCHQRLAHRAEVRRKSAFYLIKHIIYQKLYFLGLLRY